MISVSSAYKQAMNKPFRDRAYISVGIGVINQNAQESGVVNADLSYWSKGDIFNTNQSYIEYATLEENHFKADGSMYFMPENDGAVQLLTNGIVAEDFGQGFRIDFPQIYAIKGITLEFGSAYPTEFTVETSEKTLTFINDSSKFVTDEVLGDTDYIVITPISMVGGKQRFRIQSVLMGVGLAYSNNQTKSAEIVESVSSISDELPSENFKFSFYDEENRFNIDDENSFVAFLETMQKIQLSFGMTLEDGSVEWHQISTTYLKDWKSQKGIVTLTSTDRLEQMEDEYSLANRIYDRTAYEEAQSIMADAGLEPDEYYLDEYLNDVPLHNPMPEGTHKECLQILANACRCIIKQDESGRIMIVANFANVLDPDDLEVSTNGVAPWSKPRNVLIGTDIVYADLTLDFFKADGSMYFLPEDESYLETGYVSEQISDNEGLFEHNPTLTIAMPAAYTYFGVNVDFGGNPPREMIIHTYKNDAPVASKKFVDLSTENVLFNEFTSFDTMVFEFTKAYPHNRIIVNKLSFGSLSDYVLSKTDMLGNPVGYRERRVKAVRCKIYSFALDEDGLPEEVEDNVFVAKVLNKVGEIKTVQNPLVSTESHAELLAEWIGNYYANNVSYDASYRGRPDVKAADVIHMESDVLNNLQVEVSKHTLKYNGSFSGKMELRRALKMMGG